MKRIPLFLTILLFLASCKTQKGVSKPTSNTEPKVNTAFYNKIKEEPSFKTLKITSNMSVETEAFVPPLNSVIYIENQEKIWMNVSAMLINVARGIVTKDGIKGYEKWNKTYIDSDFGYLNQLLNINFIDYKAVQNLLLGRVFIPINENDFTLNQNAQSYTLISSKNQKVTVNEALTEYKISLDFSTDFDLNKIILQNAKTSEQLEVYYTNWSNFGAERFPKNVKIIIKGDKTDQILMENTKFEFIEMNTPYSVPNNYKKKDIK